MSPDPSIGCLGPSRTIIPPIPLNARVSLIFRGSPGCNSSCSQEVSCFKSKSQDWVEHLCSYFCPGGSRKAHETWKAQETQRTTKLSPKVTDIVNKRLEEVTLRGAVCPSRREPWDAAFMSHARMRLPGNNPISSLAYQARLR